jgi:cell division septation protein DedD
VIPLSALRLGALVLAVVLAGACAPVGAPPAPPRPLSADSLALLEEAVQRARPAYPTQAEALRAGVYGRRAEAAAPVPAAPRDPPAEPRAPVPVPAPEPVPGSPGGPYVIQIGAFPDRAAAEAAGARARTLLGEVEISYEWAGEFLRVAVGGWPTLAEAEQALPEIRRVYPDAWARRRAGG